MRKNRIAVLMLVLCSTMLMLSATIFGAQLVSSVIVLETDWAVLDVTASPTYVTAGEMVSINVLVHNNGPGEEPCDVYVYYDSNLIWSQTGVTSGVCEDTTLAFNWDTTGVPEGAYTIMAEALCPADPDLGNNMLVNGVVGINVFPVYVDIKPGSWPNPLKLRDNGVLPVAVCGTEEFDVTTIDTDTVRLTLEGVPEGVAPLSWSYEDVATPYTDDSCGGHDLDGDGYLDLALKFKTEEVIETLGLDAFSSGEVVILILTGNLKEEFDGTPIQGQDCIVIHACIESCDSAGTIKDTFFPGEDVYVVGGGYKPLWNFTIHVVEDVTTWTDVMAIPPRVPGTAFGVASDAAGNIPPWLVWSAPLTIGKYDIVVDVNWNGVYDECIDALDDSDVEVTAGFNVIPEVAFGTIMASAAMIIALVAYVAVPKWRRKQ